MVQLVPSPAAEKHHLKRLFSALHLNRLFLGFLLEKKTPTFRKHEDKNLGLFPGVFIPGFLEAETKSLLSRDFF